MKASKTMTTDPVLLRIIGLFNEKGKAYKDLTDYLGLSQGTL